MRWCVFFAFSLSGVFVLSASAQDAHDAPHPSTASSSAGREAHSDVDHGPKYELLTIDGMTAVWTIIIFVIVLVVLRAAAWKPIQKVLTDRERFIADSLAQAKQDREEAQKVLAQYSQKLQDAREEAGGIVEEGRRDALVVKRKIEEETKAEAAAMLERAKREIGLAADHAIRRLYDLTGDFATQMASRIIRRELDPKEHERLIAESIDELQRSGGNGRSVSQP